MKELFLGDLPKTETPLCSVLLRQRDGSCTEGFISHRVSLRHWQWHSPSLDRNCDRRQYGSQFRNSVLGSLKKHWPCDFTSLSMAKGSVLYCTPDTGAA